MTLVAVPLTCRSWKSATAREVLATNGDTHPGGDDFDEAITILADEFKNRTALTCAKTVALQRLKEAAEKAKRTVVGRATPVSLPFITMTEAGPKHLNINLTRATFENITKAWIERSRGHVSGFERRRSQRWRNQRSYLAGG